MYNLRKSIFQSFLVLLVGCTHSPIDFSNQTSPTSPPLPPETNNVYSTQTPIRLSDQIPANSPTATRIPEQILGDIFLYDKSGARFGTFFDGSNWDGNVKIEQIESYAEITSGCSRTGNYGVKIYYDEADTGVWWYIINLGGHEAFDIKNYQALELWVKGTVGGEEFDIDLATPFGADIVVESTKYVEVSPFEWRVVHIPLSDFENTNPHEWTTLLYYVSIHFSSGSSKTICIDDIQFTP